MPLPNPRADEDRDDFIDRCMSDGNSEEECEVQWDNSAQAQARGPRYQRILQAFYGSPWAILPAKLAEIRAFLRYAAEGGKFTPEEVRARLGDAASRAPR